MKSVIGIIVNIARLYLLISRVLSPVSFIIFVHIVLNSFANGNVFEKDSKLCGDRTLFRVTQPPESTYKKTVKKRGFRHCV